MTDPNETADQREDRLASARQSLMSEVGDRELSTLWRARQHGRLQLGDTFALSACKPLDELPELYLVTEVRESSVVSTQMVDGDAEDGVRTVPPIERFDDGTIRHG